MTVKELMKECKELIDSGMGDKEIWLSRDDEGNGYHHLLYSFMTDKEDIEAIYEMGMFDSPVSDKDNIVILG